MQGCCRFVIAPCNIRREMQAVTCSKPFALETCSDNHWYFIGFNAEYLHYKRACHDSQTDPWMCPWLHYSNLLLELQILPTLANVPFSFPHRDSSRAPRDSPWHWKVDEGLVLVSHHTDLWERYTISTNNPISCKFEWIRWVIIIIST